MIDLNRPFVSKGPTTVQDAAVATGNGVELVITEPSKGGYSIVCFQVLITTTATITFEGTVDGTNWFSIAFLTLADGTTFAATATASGGFQAMVAGVSRVRARISAWTAGAVTVVGQVVG